MMTYDEARRRLQWHTVGPPSPDGFPRVHDAGFMQSFWREDPQEADFHQVMEALLALGERFHGAAQVDRDVMGWVLSLSHVARGRAFPTSGPLRRRREFGRVPIDRIEAWLDAIDKTMIHLLHGDSPQRALIVYAQYILDHGPGPSTDFVVELAVRALEDETIVGATSAAEVVARLGATAALPALRKASQRDYRDPNDMPAMAGAFDAEIKRVLEGAIARLERRAGE